ncbi:hypothetical protein K1719_003460 [Acacia pycnantha]|nr:hypothetical protein K1719_003460 [Acacia pycnantha]
MRFQRRGLSRNKGWRRKRLNGERKSKEKARDARLVAGIAGFRFADKQFSSPPLFSRSKSPLTLTRSVVGVVGLFSPFSTAYC